MKVIELQYLPQPAYFAALLIYPDLLLDSQEYFVKQSYRNRCRILAANGIDTLSVPVHGSGKKIPVRDIRIDHGQKWINRHWRAIQSAYGKAPFFEFYAGEIRTILLKKHEFLFDLNLELLTQCLDFLQIDRLPGLTSRYEELDQPRDLDLRDVISPKVNRMANLSYNQVPYQQVFGSNFVEGISVIDLLFCEGPNAGTIIRQGIESGTE